MLFPINLDFDGNYIKISFFKKKNPYSYSLFKKNLLGSPVINYEVLAWGQLLKSKGEGFIPYYSELIK